MVAVKGQCHTLLGRLEVMGPGTAAAAGRRREASAQEEKWRRVHHQSVELLLTRLWHNLLISAFFRYLKMCL